MYMNDSFVVLLLKNLADSSPKDGLVQDMAHIDCALAQQVGDWRNTHD